MRNVLEISCQEAHWGGWGGISCPPPPQVGHFWVPRFPQNLREWVPQFTPVGDMQNPWLPNSHLSSRLRWQC